MNAPPPRADAPRGESFINTNILSALMDSGCEDLVLDEPASGRLIGGFEVLALPQPLRLHQFGHQWGEFVLFVARRLLRERVHCLIKLREETRPRELGVMTRPFEGSDGLGLRSPTHQLQCETHLGLRS